MKRKAAEDKVIKRPRRQARTPEERENYLINLALDRVEERILNGTASGQELVQLIRMASSKSRYENEKLQLELDLTRAKTENLRQQARFEDMLADAMNVFKQYSGAEEEEYEEDV